MECTPETFQSNYLGANDAYATSGCHMFHDDRPMTMALSVLVIIELLNALNRQGSFIFFFTKTCNIILLLGKHFFCVCACIVCDGF